jgi:hypothetical protein
MGGEGKEGGHGMGGELRLGMAWGGGGGVTHDQPAKLVCRLMLVVSRLVP